MECKRIDTEDELKQAFAIRMEVFVDEQGVPESEEMDEYDVLSAPCTHFLLWQDGVPIATGRWREYDDRPGAVKIQRFAVRARYRGTGAGRVLMEGMERDARTRGFTQAVLDAQCTAEPFYLKLGYVTESEEAFLDAGILHVRMSRSLK
ncbi:GNAT family N-acetyltransferase [Cohnella faecalis]|uniref:GNAT family N-acetyltransferase n=1 Tax=Cohnella faecalis TaxID=2315694 RepID=A0A398CYD3_9BACL|nr:GNAT family N-acetyltransferase [Cohnella faecalis]RIE04817.1 GNAT family N-acetyltransferase [Cohnella faecalis]